MILSKEHMLNSIIACNVAGKANIYKIQLSIKKIFFFEDVLKNIFEDKSYVKMYSKIHHIVKLKKAHNLYILMMPRNLQYTRLNCQKRVDIVDVKET